MHGHDTYGFIAVVGHAVMITGFVFVMMLVVEYLNVLSRGRLNFKLARGKWTQYLLAAVLGAVPGCLGAFAVVGMYSHRVMSLGAVVTAMIATTGDEAFLMLAKIPLEAMLITIGLAVLGIAAGVVTDFLIREQVASVVPHDHGFKIHDEHLNCYASGRILEQWRKCSPARGILGVGLVLFIGNAVFGGFEAYELWVRVTLIVVSTMALFIVVTVPDHFLDEHLWSHVARKHVPKIFLWACGALFVLSLFAEHITLEGGANGGAWILLGVACLVGLIPQSGPHYIFIILYAEGSLPLGVLVASSIVQEGHGMLPMLANSKYVFVGIKVFKMLLGFIIGAALIVVGL
ncbi:MAG: arsenic efflux protein [Kiritimatiellae bacterium]|nr:arsenic efflux protein [Kiritimatiellia bacterium]